MNICVISLCAFSVMVDHPLHVRQHAKHVLTEAIVTDTHFLSSHLVMDYSLLVGVDETNKQLVVGIIGLCLSPFCVRHLGCQLITFHLVFVAFYSDYIRTFTWDKKMEMYFKSNLIPGKFPLSCCTRLHAECLVLFTCFSRQAAADSVVARVVPNSLLGSHGKLLPACSRSMVRTLQHSIVTWQVLRTKYM